MLLFVVDCVFNVVVVVPIVVIVVVICWFVYYWFEFTCVVAVWVFDGLILFVRSEQLIS